MNITLRAATPDDAPLLREWDDMPHVIAAHGGDVDEEDDEDDFDWDYELPRTVPWRELLIAELDGRPVGFMQLIDALNEETHYWGDIEPNVMAIDIWIGAVADLGQGFGTQMMHQALERCFLDPGVTAVVIDPLITNYRAIEFYKRLGFKEVGPRRFDEDNCLVMRIERDQCVTA